MTAYTFDQLITFTRTSAATYVGSNGLVAVTPASRNLLTYTQEFDNAAWTKTNTTVTANSTTAPDGTLTADALVEDTSSSRHSASQTATITASAAHSTSIYVKAGTGRYFTLSVSRAAAGSVYYAARYDLQTATVTATGTGGGGGTHTASSITAVGDGWYRCVLTGVLSTFTDAVVMASGAINPTGFGDRGAEVYTGSGLTWFIWGAQLEAASAATTYTRNNGGVYPPRFDYDPVTRAPRGLLIEEQRTNLFTRSEEFDNGSWVKANATVTANAIAAPDGATTADKLALNNGVTGYIYRNTGISSGSAAFSIFVKAAEWNFVRVLYGGSFSPNAATYIRLSDGVVTSGSGFTAQSVGNGWYRITGSSTYSTATDNTIYVIPTNSGTSETTGDGTSGIYIWGGQMEAGAFATSYIPTVASQVTRTADQASIVAPMFAPWYRQSEGTFVVQWDGFRPTTASGVPHIFQVGNGSNSFIDTVLSGPNYLARVTAGGVDQSAISTAYAANSVEKIASAYKLNDFAFSRNGAAVLMDASGTPPTGIDRMGVGVSQSGTFALNGHIRSIDYYPTRLTNAQIQALTA